jgi:transposase
MAPLILSDRQRAELEALVVRTPSAKERSRAQALLRLAEGDAVEGVADLLQVSRQTVYNRMGRSRERSGLDLRMRLRDAPRPGRTRTRCGVVDSLIAGVIDSDPRGLGYHATVRTAPLLCRYLQDRHEIDVCDRTVSRAITRPGIRWKRPRHQLALRPATWRQSKDSMKAGAVRKADLSK